jgi:predicted metal-dependent phosphoesterase TrpH
MLFDLHLHSRFSIDALSSPKTIVKICKKNNWGFALTDHNNMGAYSGPNSVAKLAKKEGVFCIPSEEIKVLSADETSGKKKTVGEVVAYFLDKPIVPDTFENILDQVRKQDALLSCPHPFDWPRKNFKRFPKVWKEFDAMELYNARAYYAGLNKKSQIFYSNPDVMNSLAGLGVSDAHTPEEIGNGLTEIDAVNESEFRKEIKKRRTKVVARFKASFWHHFQTQMAKRNLMKER